MSWGLKSVSTEECRWFTGSKYNPTEQGTGRPYGKRFEVTWGRRRVGTGGVVQRSEGL